MFLYSLAVLAAVLNSALSNPVSVQIRDDSTTSVAGPVKLTGFDKCTADQTNAINTAWDEAIQVASAVTVQGGQVVRTSYPKTKNS